MYERQEERLSPLPKIGEGFGEWSEAPSYEEGVGVDGKPEGLPSEKRGFFQSLRFVKAAKPSGVIGKNGL